MWMVLMWRVLILRMVLIFRMVLMFNIFKFLFQSKFMDIEDELKVVGQNQQTLEVRFLVIL